MTTPITVLAPIKLAAGKIEEDLLAASDRFQREFVNDQPGVIRRELVRKDDGTYLDIVQFRSMKDAEEIMELERDSATCQAFFAVMDMEATDESDSVDFYQSLVTYG